MEDFRDCILKELCEILFLDLWPNFQSWRQWENSFSIALMETESSSNVIKEIIIICHFIAHFVSLCEDGKKICLDSSDTLKYT